MNAAKIAFIILVAVLFSACDTQRSAPQQSKLPFEFTNIVLEPSVFRKQPTPLTLINFTNLVWFGHESDKISMGLGPADYEISVFFDRTNRTVRKIVQQTSVGTNRFWLIDIDGDGIPDERRKFHEEQRELLFQGEWRTSRGASTNREVMVDSNWTKVRFHNSRWRSLN